jgi:hypothetical protein
MAVVKEARGSRLQIVVQVGTDAGGQPLLRTRSFSGVKVDAVDTDLFDVAQAIAALQQYPINSIRRVDDGELIEQP